MLSEVALTDKLQRNKLQSVWGARCDTNKADIGSSGHLSKMTGAREESLIIYKQKSAISDICPHWLDKTSGCLVSNTRSWFMFNLKSRGDRKCVEIRLQHHLLPGILHGLWWENDEQVLRVDSYIREYCRKIRIPWIKVWMLESVFLQFPLSDLNPFWQEPRQRAAAVSCWELTGMVKSINELYCILSSPA